MIIFVRIAATFVVLASVVCAFPNEGPLTRTTNFRPLLPGQLVRSPGGGAYLLSERVHGPSAMQALEGAEVDADAPVCEPQEGEGGQCTLRDEALTPFTGETKGAPSASYRMAGQIGAGHQGEVWRAVRLDAAGEADPLAPTFILKRLFSASRPSFLSGWREVFFGRKFARAAAREEGQGGPAPTTAAAELRALPYVARFEEHFVREGLWLVFRDEGVSLHRLLYETGDTAGAGTSPGPFWVRLRTSPAGPAVLRDVLTQLVDGLHAVHASGVAAHRDVKPGNILLNVQGGEEDGGRRGSGRGGRASRPSMHMVVRLADFGSAVDEDAVQSLYPRPHDEGVELEGGGGGEGPTASESTLPYAPPEVLFSSDGRPYHAAAPHTYDSWSLGMTALELVLGEPPGHVLDLPVLLGNRAAAFVTARINAAFGEDGEVGRGEVRGGWQPLGARAAAMQYAALAAACLAPPASEQAPAAPLPDQLQRVQETVNSILDAARRHVHPHGGGLHECTSDVEERLRVEAAAGCGKEGFVKTLRFLSARAQAVAERGSPTEAASGETSTRQRERDAAHARASSLMPRPSGVVTLSDLSLALVEVFDSPSGPTPGMDAQSPTALARQEAVDGDGLLLSMRASSAVEGGVLALVDASSGEASATLHHLLLPSGAAQKEAEEEGGVAGAGAERGEGLGRHGCVPLAALYTPVPLLGSAGEDLLFRLLGWDAEGRLTTEEAAQHPFFAQGA